MPPDKLSRPFWLTAVGCSVLAFCLYAFTVAPDVTFTDAGELAACCLVWGVAHPTGYPLFTLLGRTWLLLTAPFAPPISALNLLAAVYTALSVLAFFGICWEILQASHRSLHLHHQLVVCSLGALTYASARTVWAQGTAIEVYSIHLALLWLAAWGFLRAWRTGNAQFLLGSAYLFGLGLTNHAMMMLLGPAFLWLLVVPLRRWDRRLLASIGLALTLALLLYLSLPLRSAAQPPLDWGGVARGWEKFFAHITGRQYQVWMFADRTTWVAHSRLFLELLPWQLGLIGLPFTAIGLFRLWKLQRPLAIWLLLVMAGCLVYALNYSIHDIAPYFLQAYGALGMATTVGIASVWERLRITPLLRYSFIALPLLNLATNWHFNNRRHDWIVPHYLRLITELAQPNALIISSQWDFWCSAFWYKQMVEKVRPDIVLVEQELVRRTWYPPQLRRWYPEVMACCTTAQQVYEQQLELFESGRPYEVTRLQRAYESFFNTLIDAHISHRPVYVTPEVIAREPAIGATYIKIPEGPLLRLSSRADTLSPRLLSLSSLEPLSASLRRYHYSSLVQDLRRLLINGFTASFSYAQRHGQQQLSRQLQLYLQLLNGALMPASGQ